MLHLPQQLEGLPDDYKARLLEATAYVDALEQRIAVLEEAATVGICANTQSTSAGVCGDAGAEGSSPRKGGAPKRGRNVPMLEAYEASAFGDPDEAIAAMRAKLVELMAKRDGSAGGRNRLTIVRNISMLRKRLATLEEKERVRADATSAVADVSATVGMLLSEPDDDVCVVPEIAGAPQEESTLVLCDACRVSKKRRALKAERITITDTSASKEGAVAEAGTCSGGLKAFREWPVPIVLDNNARELIAFLCHRSSLTQEQVAHLCDVTSRTLRRKLKKARSEDCPAVGRPTEGESEGASGVEDDDDV